MEYRREIDGLRAIAVIPVILFHAGFEHFSGGYVGVDIFFVISGYLITTIILSEKEQGKFSIINFYERRIRRILPVLFFIVALCVPFAWFLLLPSDLKDFSQSLVAISLFSSNILFWLETGYWEAVNELKPLLHTWSLAVEEQYYVLYPIFLMFMWRFRKRWLLVSFLIIAGISFLLAEFAVNNAPIANFFLLPTRGWELAIGAIIAVYFFYKKNIIRSLLTHKILNEIAGLIGLGMIFYSVFFYTESTPFPSRYALIPTFGTGLIIMFSSQDTIVGQLLGNKLLVGTGLISYSAYLWHQPLFAFARHAFLNGPDLSIFTILILITFLLSYFSWRYVEVPFRNKHKYSRQFIFITAIIGSLFFIGIGALGHFNNGFDKRVTETGLTIKELDERTRVNHGLSKICEGEFTLSEDCRNSEDPEILIWGDSYVMHLVQGVLASNTDAKVIQMTKSVCGPFFEVAPIYLPEYPLKWAEGCLEFNEKVKNWLKNSNVKYVVMSSSFYTYLDIENTSLLYQDGQIKKSEMNLVVKEFENTLHFIKSLGIKPVIFSPTPENNREDLGKCLVRAEFFNRNKDECNFIAEESSRFMGIVVHEFLQRIAENFDVIRLDNFLCKESKCITHIDETFIYRDKGHLSYEGSAIVGRRMNFYKLITQKKID